MLPDFRDCRAIIFDLDGTLADTVDAIREGINLAMTQFHFPERSYDQVIAAVGNGARMLVRRCMPREKANDEALLAEVLATYDAAYARTYMHTRHCYAGIPEAVAALHRAGYRLAVLSNKQDAYVKALIRQLFPDNEFTVVMGQCELPLKPDPTVPAIIAERLGAKLTECIMIGDSDVDIRTAQNAGMRAIGCSWGFRGHEALVMAGAPHIADTPDQLLDLLLPRA